jgi:ribosomal protein L34
MTKRTLSNKTRSSVLKVSGFRARMATAQGRKIIRVNQFIYSNNKQFFM